MDQQKIQRLLRLLMMLAGKRWHSLNELMEKIESSGRTVYRYLETLETAGFVLEKNKGSYRLQRTSASTRSLQNLMHFSEEEVLILYETLALIEGSSPVKEQLIRKLNSLYDYKALAQLQQSDDLTKIQLLSEAIRNKKQVNLKSYRSSNSDKIRDRKVEPFDYLPDYRSVWCYEYETKSCKQFKLARIHEIELINRDWENELLHKVPFTDAFRISSAKPIDNVEAKLSLKACNLLLEEFPLCRDHVNEEDGHYHLKIPVAGYQGIGRFVMGLPGEVEVLDSKGFKEFLKKEKKKFFD
ncbi:WYL domain-containing protein [Hanamia caeni]|jgi:predicted DNA-binding transcriptional regulator YafY|uniref:WYL domain-containing protein n=1 Tax=Hanamia caeni TaxID=2294116 RepID=A0A3M9NIA3_9BACT|nr:WYL domain-containing protein [Hanamia caeni]RNI36708.1 WYL domain-containing protein [Hanamia caeni]